MRKGFGKNLCEAVSMSIFPCRFQKAGQVLGWELGTKAGGEQTDSLGSDVTTMPRHFQRHLLSRELLNLQSTLTEGTGPLCLGSQGLTSAGATPQPCRAQGCPLAVPRVPQGGGRWWAGPLTVVRMLGQEAYPQTRTLTLQSW